MSVRMRTHLMRLRRDGDRVAIVIDIADVNLYRLMVWNSHCDVTTKATGGEL